MRSLRCRCGEPPKRNCGREDRACIATEDLSTPGSETPSTAVPGAAAHATFIICRTRRCRAFLSRRMFSEHPISVCPRCGCAFDRCPIAPPDRSCVPRRLPNPNTCVVPGRRPSKFLLAPGSPSLHTSESILTERLSSRRTKRAYFRASVALFLHPRVVTSLSHIQMFACGNSARSGEAGTGAIGDKVPVLLVLSSRFLSKNTGVSPHPSAYLLQNRTLESPLQTSTKFRPPKTTYCERANMDPSPSGRTRQQHAPLGRPADLAEESTRDARSAQEGWRNVETTDHPFAGPAFLMTFQPQLPGVLRRLPRSVRFA